MPPLAVGPVEGALMVAGASCPIQSQDRPADAATSLALLTWIWQLASRHQTDGASRGSIVGRTQPAIEAQSPAIEAQFNNKQHCTP